MPLLRVLLHFASAQNMRDTSTFVENDISKYDLIRENLAVGTRTILNAPKFPSCAFNRTIWLLFKFNAQNLNLNSLRIYNVKNSSDGCD